MGSIVDAPTAALYISSGANFVVGPLLNPEVGRLCNRRKIAYSPGCGSVSEIGRAEELGVEIVKVFPGSEVGGPAFVKSVLGPCPWTRIMPTGGVDATRESLEGWFNAGVAAVGAGSKLITKELVETKDWDGLAAKVRQSVEWIAEIRAEVDDERLLELVPDFRLDDITAALFGGDRLFEYDLEFTHTDRKLIAVEYGEFGQAILDGRSPEVGGEQGARSVALAYALMESQTAARSVSVDEVLADRTNAYQDDINASLGI